MSKDHIEKTDFKLFQKNLFCSSPFLYKCINRYYHKGVGFMISSDEAHAAFR